jgi:hypothetical protein
VCSSWGCVGICGRVIQYCVTLVIHHGFAMSEQRGWEKEKKNTRIKRPVRRREHVDQIGACGRQLVVHSPRRRNHAAAACLGQVLCE